MNSFLADKANFDYKRHQKYPAGSYQQILKLHHVLCAGKLQMPEQNRKILQPHNNFKILLDITMTKTRHRH